MFEWLQAALQSLTEFEKIALAQAFESSAGNGHDFGFAEDIDVPGCLNNGGVIGSLVKKGILVWDGEYGQIAFAAWDDSRHDAADVVAKFLAALDN
jgi:hypothetical protein